jgi:DNA invertase Pin-like site-specific DNA recombinase
MLELIGTDNRLWHITLVATVVETSVMNSIATKWVTYSRVSTVKSQGVDGLGIAAQQMAITSFLSGRPNDTVVGTYVEAVSGTKNERPQLLMALNECRLRGAKLLIAKLDRVSRRVSFIANLMESDVPFVVADMPTADSFRLHIEASIGEDERKKISARTKAALQAAKAKGVVLGGYRAGTEFNDDARIRSAVVRTTNAVTRSKRNLEVIASIKEAGIVTYSAIADELNKRGITTPSGKGQWQATQVMRECKRTA